MPAVAIGAIFAAVGTAVAVGMNAQAKSEAAAAKASAAEQEAKWRQEQLDFAKKQYARWEQDFGEIQTEVADYYKNLTDDILKQQYEDANAEANQSLVKQYFAAQKNLNSQFNKTGMAGSGAEAASTLKLQQSMLQQKATNRWQTQQLKANAQNVLMGQKQQWVSQGENLRSQATSLQASALSEAASSAAADKRLYAEMEYQANQNMINSVSSGLMNMGGAFIGLGGQMYTADTFANSIKDTSILDGEANFSDYLNTKTTSPYRSSLNTSNWIDNTYYRLTEQYARNPSSVVRQNNVKTTSLYNSMWR